MNNYQGFFSWCKTNNLSLLDFKKTTGNQKQFCEFIVKNYKTQSLLHNIHQSEIFLAKLKKKKDVNKFILTNMRMSISELG